jgi:hypothetical protein
MGKLREHGSEHVHTLPGRCLVGRSGLCSLVLSSEIVSAEHAIIRWSGEAWTIQDLGSTNGTYLDGRRATPGERLPVLRSCAVGFGHPAPSFTLVDDSPPGASAESFDGTRLFATRGILALPSGDDPQMTVYQAHDQRWVLESTNELRPAVDQEIVHAGSSLFRLNIPTVLADTSRLDGDEFSINDVALRFLVSPDEDHVEVELHCRGATVQLPPRAHDYLLLTLARVRIADQKNPTVSSGEAGWVHPDDLIRMLRTNENHLNVAVYRARRQFAETKVAGAAMLIERRPDSRQLRIGVRALVVERC